MMEALPKFTAREWRHLIGDDARCVIEAGSHDGSDTEMLLEAFPAATVYCWEPDARPRKRFLDRLGQHPRVVLSTAAVCDYVGYAPWFACHGSMPTDNPDTRNFPTEMQRDWDASGSIVEPTGHKTSPGWLRFKQEGVVPTMALDAWLLDHDGIHCVDLLWSDIQGAELKMIAGAQCVLAMTRYAYLEVYDLSLTGRGEGVPAELYKNQPSLADLQAALPGWELLGFYNGDSVLFRNTQWEPRL